MVMPTAPPKFCAAEASSHTFFALFPHRFDYIYAPHPEPGTTPHWQTESRHLLTDRLLSQGSYLYGVRFGVKTQYCLLDIDAGSPYHPDVDPFAVQRILDALETLGLVSYLACTSSYSGGLHLYFPFQSAQSSWELGAVIAVLLENAGLIVKPGWLEVFPNRKSYSIQGKPSLFNAHRLPLQMGSYLLNRDFEPVWSSRHTFVQQWRSVQNQNEISSKLLTQILKQSQRKHYQVSGKAAKFINDLNAEIELGWTGHGQTNYLLGRITMRTYIFHHILEGGLPLEGQALVDEIVSIARSLPGYQEWCQHQHEIEHRAAEWARCIENSHYFHYGSNSQNRLNPNTDVTPNSLSWNQQRSENTRERIKQAIADLLNRNALPVQATARFKCLTSYGIGGSSLYSHKDLWHPEHLNSNLVDSETIYNCDAYNRDIYKPDNHELESTVPEKPYACSTSLLPVLDGNSAQAVDSSDRNTEQDQGIDRNLLPDAVFQCSTEQNRTKDDSFFNDFCFKPP
jgi:hypothetical protein